MTGHLRNWLYQQPHEGEPAWVDLVREGDWSAIPLGLEYGQSGPLAMALDGYEASRRLGSVTPRDVQQTVASAYRESGVWSGSAIELWIALFFQHRADHFTVMLALPEHRPELDQLVDALRTALVEGRHWPNGWGTATLSDYV